MLPAAWYFANCRSCSFLLRYLPSPCQSLLFLPVSDTLPPFSVSTLVFPPISATLRLSSVSVSAISENFCHTKAWFCVNSLLFLPFLTRFWQFSCLFVGLRGGEGSPPSGRGPSPSRVAPLAGPSLYKRGCLRFRTLPLRLRPHF